MAIIRWDPLQEATALQDRINRLFEDAFPRCRESEGERSSTNRIPVVDVYETENALVLDAEIPGVRKEEVTVEIREQRLTIRGERRRNPVLQDDQYIRRERYFGGFQRTFNLPYAVNPDAVRARFKDGVLIVELPKPEAEKNRKIRVHIE